MGVFGSAWLVGSLLTRPTNAIVAPIPAPAERISIDEQDGVHLAGSYWPSLRASAPAILLLHGNGAHRGSVVKTAGWLNENGYAVLAVDFRGHGESSSATKSFGLFEADDAHAAFAWLQEKTHRKIGVVGFSLGGAASLLGAQGPLPADAFVLEGVYPDIRHAIFDRIARRLGAFAATLIEPILSFQSLLRYGVLPSAISPIRALSGVSVPVMIVGGGSDENTPPAETRAMFDVVKTHGELWILQGVGHAALGQNPPGTLKAALLAFLGRNLALDQN